MFQQSRWFVLLGLACVSSHAAANGLLGATVSYTGYCCTAPVASDAVTNTATAVVGPGVEFPVGSVFGPGVPDTMADVSAFQVTATVFTPLSNVFYEPGAFDGGVLTFSGPSFTRITSVTVDAASTFVPASVTFTDHAIFDNVAGLPFFNGALTILDVGVAPVPEPATAWLMVASVLFGRGVIQQSRRRSR